MRTKKEENALQEDNLKLFNQLNLYKIQKILSNIVKLPDFVSMPVVPKSWAYDNKFRSWENLESCSDFDNQSNFDKFREAQGSWPPIGLYKTCDLPCIDNLDLIWAWTLDLGLTISHWEPSHGVMTLSFDIYIDGIYFNIHQKMFHDAFSCTSFVLWDWEAF